MHHYSAYGLSIRSHRPIPELPAGKAPSSFPVVSIRWNAVDAETDMSSGPQTAYRVRPESLCIRFHDLGAFLFEPDRITVDPLPGASLEAVRLMLVGSVLGLFLRRRGLLTLHGNAVACEAGAAVVLGASGAGKSTLTAALHRRGAALLGGTLPGPRAPQQPVDRRLLAGAAVFGVGWGLAGLCPGPAITNLARLQLDVVAFVAAMAVGSVLAQRLFGADA